MSQKDQQPIPCSGCGVIISQIEPDEETEHRSLHWGQQIDYWSVEFHSWEKNSSDSYPSEDYSLCTPCKEKITKALKDK